MTDKVQKIREEVARMHDLLPVMDGDNIYLNYADRICTTLEMYIDSLQEEPVSDVWHDMSEEAENGRNIIIIDPKDFYGAVLRKGGSQLKNHNKERYVKWAYIDDLFNL